MIYVKDFAFFILIMFGWLPVQRTILRDLLDWKARKGRKPLILKGVRQCGKTYILKHFAEQCYENVAYFNFEGNSALADRFEKNLDPERIITELGILNGKRIHSSTTLIIFDEIQFCSRAITSLKYFYEKSPEYHIVCAGSLLGIALSNPSSFPVGKVEFLTLRPMSFYEFLLAHKEEMLLEHLTQEAKELRPLPQIFVDKLTAILKSYYITGGMPEVVATWLDSSDIGEVERVQENILNSYELDFSKHAPRTEFPRLSAIWKSIPDQLARESGKFVYGHAKPGARAKELEDALEWLIRAGLVYKVTLVEKPFLPLSTYSKGNYFKIYMADVGLLRKMAKLPPSAILEDNVIYKEFKGALVENYVLQELANLIQDLPYYWRSGNTAEVDFLLQISGHIVPLEVKAATNIKSRSLSLYRAKFQPSLAIRCSLANLKKEGELINLPLYMIWLLKMCCDQLGLAAGAKR